MIVTLKLPLEIMERVQRLAKERKMDVSTLVLKVFLAYLDDDQSWYWSKEWQRAEREAEADLASGKYTDFSSMDDFFADMKT
jgi:predicted DNA-binding protein